jgi:hypothetical protein
VFTSASAASSVETPAAWATTERCRARSFSFSGATPTIRFPCVRPSRIIEIVEIVFSTSFCAVPAFSRVEPAITSAPTGTHTSRSASFASSDPSTHVTQPVNAPRERAASSAPTTHGDRPLALTATTASASDTPSASIARAPPVRSSSASSLGATTAVTGTENVGSHSTASRAARCPEVPAPA